MPHNLSVFTQSGSYRVEAGRIIHFQVFGRQEARATSTQLPYCTLDTAIARILHMQDYTTFETAEVVGHLPFFRLFFLSLSFYNYFSIVPQVVIGIQNLMR